MKFKRSLLKMVSLSCLLVLGSNYTLATEIDSANPSEAKTPVSGELGLSANGGCDPNPPSDLNIKTEINNSYLGISYIPATFDFGATKLIDNVQKQTVSTKKENKTFNVGVKDKRRQDTQHWSLNVKHNMSINNGYQGVSLTVPINQDIKRNMNDGVSDFQSNELTDQIKKYGSDEVKKAEESTINITTQENTIMHTTGGQFVNGVYDLELGDVTLNIPDASRIPAQTIDGTVEWTLSNTPMKQSYLTEKIRNLFKDGNCKELKTTITSEQVEAAKQSIESIEDEKQKTYNQEYFEKYVEGHFIEWCGRGIYSIDFAKLCYFKNATNSSAEVLFKKEKNKPNYCFGRQEYMRVTIQRGDDLILDEHIEGNDTTPLSTTSAVVQPGDTIEIYHVEGKNDRLGVYPSQYKTGGTTEGNRRTLKYQVTDSLDLKAM
ncbi:WxL domain-containing protein [Enterococcus mundtii]|uniref:WxL domain-containing protein n=1 Tax=Enterococcus mundtii TaxID=53346 RepID=UPI000DFEE124|nr:WxL domain-containing protein [Enterococcus mundtii]STD22022.1 membrane associated lipoprotein [Enterococcus mundtii]